VSYELLNAIARGDHEKIRRYMKEMDNPDLVEGRHSFLCDVFEYPEVPPSESLDTLVEMGINLNLQIIAFKEREDLFITPLNCLVKRLVNLWVGKDRRRLEKLWRLFERAVELGADPKYPTLSLYGDAVRYGYARLIERLHALGADPNLLTLTKVPVPPITLSRNTKVAKLLESIGAEVMAEDLLGRGPLFSLMDSSQRTWPINDYYVAPISVVKWFVKKGADPYEVMEGGITVPHLAAYGGNAKALQYFASLGVSPNRRDAEGKAPIHWAASNRSLTWSRTLLKVFDVLLSLGVSLDEPDGEGNRPIHIAARNRAYETVLYLLKLGADPSLKDSKGMTLKDILAEKGLAIRSGRVVSLKRELPDRVRDVLNASLNLREVLGEVGLALPTRKALVLYPDSLLPPKVMKVGGVPPGVGKERWPVARREVFMAILEEEGVKRRDRWWKKWRKKFGDYPEGVLPMEHFLTLDLRPLGYLPEGLPRGTVAVALFFPLVRANLKEYLAWDAEGLNSSEFYALVPLSGEDVARGPLLGEDEVPHYSGDKPPYALSYREVEVPLILREFFYMEDYASAVVKGEERVLREISPSLLKALLSVGGEERLRVIRAIHGLEQALVQVSFVGGVPIYTQEDEGDPPERFVVQLGDDITDYDRLLWSNFGLSLVYVFSHRTFAQRY